LSAYRIAKVFITELLVL